MVPENPTAGASPDATGSRILTIGLHPNALDYSRFPDLDEPKLLARIEVGNAAMRSAGFDSVSCLVSVSPDAAEREIREHLADGPFAMAMIGGAIRMIPEHTLLFERIINVLSEAAPGIVFRFNTSPETTIDAVRRMVRA
jgi:hypothetical protein